MTRTKSLRYNAASDEPLLIQSGKPFFENCKGKWKDYFGNDNPIILELACGRGEYTVWLSQIYPNKNFIGVDVKGERMMMGIRNYKSKVINDKLDDVWENSTLNTSNSTLPNIAFLRTIIHHLDQFFAQGEVDEIWIVHPDPRSKWYDERRRLTSPKFLRMYYSLLKPGGLLRLKTDDDGLFAYSCTSLSQRSTDDISSRVLKELPAPTQWAWKFELIENATDLYQSPLLAEHHGIRTHYEEIFVEQWRTVKYGKWRK